MTKPDIYLIHPVRNITENERKFFNNYVKGLEKKGLNVHYPIRDVDQDDPTGMRICCEHREAAKEVEEAHIYLNPTSTGSVFDLGMVCYLDKPIKIINSESVNVENNLVTDFLRNYSLKETTGSKSFEKILQKKEKIKRSEMIEFFWEGTPENLFEFGMAFVSEKPILFANKNEINPKEGKCYERVLLEVDNLSRIGKHINL
jgi:hypothetical protein